jgi:hypothetical protein
MIWSALGIVTETRWRIMTLSDNMNSAKPIKRSNAGWKSHIFQGFKAKIKKTNQLKVFIVLVIPDGARNDENSDENKGICDEHGYLEGHLDDFVVKTNAIDDKGEGIGSDNKLRPPPLYLVNDGYNVEYMTDAKQNHSHHEMAAIDHIVGDTFNQIHLVGK